MDDEELAALEYLDKVNGWDDEDADEEEVGVAKAVAARDFASDGAAGEEEDDEEEGEGEGDYDDEEEEEEGEEEDTEDGVALLRELFEVGPDGFCSPRRPPRYKPSFLDLSSIAKLGEHCPSVPSSRTGRWT